MDNNKPSTDKEAPAKDSSKPQDKKPTPREKKALTTATYEALNPVDVLLGRGKRASLWRGNLRYKRIIYSFLPAYEAASKNAEKTGITGEIVATVKRSGGRFLKENPKTGELVEVSDLTARLKVGQAMRHRRRLREMGEEDSDDDLMATIGTAIEIEQGKKGPGGAAGSGGANPHIQTGALAGTQAGMLPGMGAAGALGMDPRAAAALQAQGQETGNLGVLIEALKQEEGFRGGNASGMMDPRFLMAQQMAQGSGGNQDPMQAAMAQNAAMMAMQKKNRMDMKKQKNPAQNQMQLMALQQQQFMGPNSALMAQGPIIPQIPGSGPFGMDPIFPPNNQFDMLAMQQARAMEQQNQAAALQAMQAQRFLGGNAQNQMNQADSMMGPGGPGGGKPGQGQGVDQLPKGPNDRVVANLPDELKQENKKVPEQAWDESSDSSFEHELQRAEMEMEKEFGSAEHPIEKSADGSQVNLNSGEALVKSFNPTDILNMVDSDNELEDGDSDRKAPSIKTDQGDKKAEQEPTQQDASKDKDTEDVKNEQIKAEDGDSKQAATKNDAPSTHPGVEAEAGPSKKMEEEEKEESQNKKKRALDEGDQDKSDVNPPAAKKKKSKKRKRNANGESDDNVSTETESSE